MTAPLCAWTADALALGWSPDRVAYLATALPPSAVLPPEVYEVETPAGVETIAVERVTVTVSRDAVEITTGRIRFRAAAQAPADPNRPDAWQQLPDAIPPWGLYPEEPETWVAHAVTLGWDAAEVSAVARACPHGVRERVRISPTAITFTRPDGVRVVHRGEYAHMAARAPAGGADPIDLPVSATRSESWTCSVCGTARSCPDCVDETTTHVCLWDETGTGRNRVRRMGDLVSRWRGRTGFPGHDGAWVDADLWSAWAVEPVAKVPAAPLTPPMAVPRTLPPVVVILDTETTGMEKSARLVEIAAVKVDARTWTVTDTFVRLINPGIAIPWQVSKVHGIRDRDVSGSPDAAQVLPEFFAFLGDAPVLAHNAAFDVRIIAADAKRVGVDTPHCRVSCTLAMARRIWPKGATVNGQAVTSHSLGELVRLLGITAQPAHRALADVHATVDVLQAGAAADPGKDLAGLCGDGVWL